MRKYKKIKINYDYLHMYTFRRNQKNSEQNQPSYIHLRFKAHNSNQRIKASLRECSNGDILWCSNRSYPWRLWISVWVPRGVFEVIQWHLRRRWCRHLYWTPIHCGCPFWAVKKRKSMAFLTQFVVNYHMEISQYSPD